MPPVKGKPRREGPFFCHACLSRQLRVERASNTRMIHGKRKTVANVVCATCGNEWWSHHSQAIRAMRAADEAGAQEATTDGSRILIDGREIAA